MAGLTRAAAPAAGEDSASIPDDYVWLLVMSFMFGIANAISHGRWQPIACALLAVALGVLGGASSPPGVRRRAPARR